MIDMIAYADRLPAAGETVHGHSFALGFGGKGANQAVMARRLGASVVMVNCIGSDVFADMTVANFVKEGIDITYLRQVDGMSSGVAPIWVEPDGTNRIIVVAGANEQLTAAEAREAVAGVPRVDVVVGQFEVPQEATAAAFCAARDRHAVTVLNPAPVAAVSESLLAVTDWLVLNEGEFAYLAHLAGVGYEGAPKDEVMAKVGARLDVHLVVTLGAAGGALIVPAAEVVRIPAPHVDVVDTTGAGDAFVGAFAYAVASDLPLADAVRLACTCASASVTRKGTQSSYLSTDEVALLGKRRGSSRQTARR
jgi:ribokinase